jgi:hypothetical protein
MLKTGKVVRTAESRPFFIVQKNTTQGQVRTVVEGGMLLDEMKREELVRMVSALATGRANDAVKLIFLTPEQVELIEGLDLNMVSELKRNANGTVEVKLLDRVKLLELMSEMLSSAQSESEKARDFFSALDRTARQLGLDDGGRAGDGDAV